MKGSWVGPARVAECVLEERSALVEDGLFVIEGPAIEEALGNEAYVSTVVEIKPETVCFINDEAVSIVDLLKHYSFRMTAGLPIARKRRA